MIPTQPTQNIATYASEAPAEMLIPPGGEPIPQQEYQEGVRPLDTLPAAWWNWLWQKFSQEEQNTVAVLNSFHAELVNLLTEGNVATPSASSVTQIAEAVKNIHERLATTTTAGSIKSDASTFGAINVDGTTGIAKMNGAGNGALDTTPQNLTDAINELVSRVAALESAPAAESIAPGIMTEFAGEFGPNYTGPGTDYSNVPSGWLACDGRALNRVTYAGLFAKIGTKWGAGDGSTTFNIPDMREAVPVGTGTRPSGVSNHDVYTLGQFKDDQFQRVKIPVGVYTTHGAISNQPGLGIYQSNGYWRGQYYVQNGGSATATPLASSMFMCDPGASVHFYDTNNAALTYPPVSQKDSDETYFTGTPRFGKVTRTKQIGVNYIIKY